MLTHPTLDQLNQLGLLGMAGAFGDMIDADTASLSHAEWLALLLEREISHRHDKRLAARLRYAKLRHQAAVEERRLPRRPRSGPGFVPEAGHRRLDRCP